MGGKMPYIHAKTFMWRSEDNLCELVLSYHIALSFTSLATSPRLLLLLFFF